MTDRSDERQLGRQLGDAVPAPGPGYWERIDAALAEVEENPDTAKPVVRLTGMNDAFNQRSSRQYILAAAAAILLVVASVAGISALAGDDPANLETDTANGDAPTGNAPTGDVETTDPLTDDEVTGDETGTGDGDDAADDEAAALEPGSICFQGTVPSTELIVRVDVFGDNSVLTATYLPGEGDPVVTVGDGTLGDDGTTMELVERTIGGDGDVETQLWSMSDDSLGLAEDVLADRVECDEVSEQLAALDDVLATNPIDPAQPGAPQPALDAGTYCFANQEDHPGDDQITLVVADDGTVTAATSSAAVDDSPAVEGKATGRFTTSNEMVVDVTRTPAGGDPSSQQEVWTLDDDAGSLTFGAVFLTNNQVPCDEVE